MNEENTIIENRELSGILPVYKEVGPTSHDIIYRVRNILKRVDKKIKVGHSGTLDPFADGVLIIGIGKGTRLLEYLKDMPKVYEMNFRLGLITDTYDITGKIEQDDDIILDKALIEEAVLSFRGAYDQVPPQYSAKKYKGRKLYELARKGEIINMPPKRIEIFKLEILEIDGRDVSIKAEVSPGTYMRSLAMDIGYRLNTGATALKLRRVVNSGYTFEKSLKVTQETSAEEIRGNIVSLHDSISFIPRIVIRKEFRNVILNGGQVFTEYLCELDDYSKDEHVRVLDESGNLIAMAKAERMSEFTRNHIKSGESVRAAKLIKVFK